MLTFGKIRELVAPYAGQAGKCPTSQITAQFARTVMQNLLYEGSPGGIKKLRLCARRGYFALPSEVEVIVQARIGHALTNVWSKWVEYNNTIPFSETDNSYQNVISEDGNNTPLAFPLPLRGSCVGVKATCEESEDSYIIIQGKDTAGVEVYTSYRGEKIYGEKFSFRNGKISYGEVVWGEITAVKKSITNGYVELFAVTPQTGYIEFLSRYSPVDETPSFKLYRINKTNCPELVEVNLAVRIRLKDNYYDNEVTLFDNELAVILTAQRINAEKNSDIQTAQYKVGAIGDLIEKEAGYKQTPTTPISMYPPLSGGSIKNIV